MITRLTYVQECMYKIFCFPTPSNLPWMPLLQTKLKGLRQCLSMLGNKEHLLIKERKELVLRFVSVASSKRGSMGWIHTSTRGPSSYSELFPHSSLTLNISVFFFPSPAPPPPSPSLPSPSCAPFRPTDGRSNLLLRVGTALTPLFFCTCSLLCKWPHLLIWLKLFNLNVPSFSKQHSEW